MGLFETILVHRTPSRDARIPLLSWWAARFAELGFTPSYGPGDHGNMSCRTKDGMLVTVRETEKAHLKPEDFVEVFGVDWGSADAAAGWTRAASATAPQPMAQVCCRGLRLPSADTLMHLRIYALRPDMQAILHGHDQAALANAEALHLPVTAHSAATPSMELIDDICQLARGHEYILLRDHGFLALGKSIDDAGELVRSINGRARSL